VKNDKSKRLLDAVGGIGDDLVSEAAGFDAKRERTKKIRKYTAVAAMFVLVAAAVVTVIMNQNKNNLPEKETSPIKFTDNSEISASGTGAALPEVLKNVRVKASAATGKIIGTDESFIVEADEGCDVDTLAEYMNVSPKTNISLAKISPTEFKVSPTSGKLFPGTVYNISFGEPENPSASYTFQTESEFFIKSVLPDDMSTGVPVNTGIEFTFSDGVGNCDFGDYITIEPHVVLDFKLYPGGRTLAAVPTEELEYNTVYTVTVKEGLTSLSGAAIAEEKKVSFRTDVKDKEDRDSALYISLSKPRDGVSESNFRYSFNGEEYIYSSDEEVSLNYSIYNYNEINSEKVTAELYKYPDAETAAEAMLKSASKTKGSKETFFTTSGLKKIGEFEGMSSGDSYEKSGTISFGTGIENGIYLAEVYASAKNRYKDDVASTKYIVIQVSDLRAFTISSDGKTLIRVDDIKSGTVTGAEVSSVSFDRTLWYDDADDAERTGVKDTAVTDGGVCTLETGDGNSAVITVKHADDAIIVCAVCSETEGGRYGMSYIYTDREKYFSNDTVNFSGFAVMLDGRAPTALYVRTSDSPAEQIEVSDKGYFSGSYKIEDRSEGGIFISVVDGDDMVVASKYIKITEEEKPQITASLTFDKLFYRFGETVTVTLRATFFDGTPAEGFDFTLSSYPFGSGNYNTLTTDKNGEIVYVIETGRISDPGSTDPSNISVYAELTGLESQMLCVNGSAYYFHSDYVFKTVWESSRRALTLHHVDTSKLLTEDDFRYDVFPKNTVGDPAEGSVNYELIKYEIIKTEKTGYDYIAKRSYTYYDYETVESTEDRGILTFSGGEIELPMKKVEGFSGGYYYKIKYNDGRNTYEEYVSATENRYVRRKAADVCTVELDKEKYSVGESFTATLEMNGTPLENTLFAVFANGLEKYGAGSSFTSEYGGTMITGSVVWAAAFDTDARAYVYSSAAPVFDTSGAALDVEITPDRETYSPGDTATVKIKVAGAKDAAVVLSVVDEACFALEDQTESSAEKYFSSVKKLSKNDDEFIIFNNYGFWFYDEYYGASGTMKQVVVNQRFSCSETVAGVRDGFGATNGIETGAPDAAEVEMLTEDSASMSGYAKGAGADEEIYVRRYFADNPVFKVTDLDENGEATVVFTVPDNITSWRITAVASDGVDGEFDKVRLGNAVTDIICTKDFFINLSAPSYYIVGDDAALLARSFGTNSEGEVEYRAILSDEEGNEISSANANDDSKGYAELNFGKIDEGHYTATVYAECGGTTDAVTSDFDVVKSAEVMKERRTVVPDEIGSISPSLFPVTLTFYDGDASHYLLNSVISSLSWGDGTARADMLAARYAALSARSRLFGEDETDESDSIKENFKNYGSTLVSLLTYSKEDTELTAGVLTVAPELLSSDRKSDIAKTLYDRVMSTEQVDEVELCSSLAALAALDEPILDVLYKTAEVAGNYSADAKLYLACAFASIGDWSAASDIYTQVRNECAEVKEEYGTLKFKGNAEADTVRLSSVALLAASRCKRSDAEMLARYLDENRSETDAVYLALASFIRYFIPSGDYEKLSVTYKIGDEVHTEEISPWNTVSVRLSKSTFNKFSVTSIDSGVAIDASYLAPAAEVLQSYDVSDRVTVSKDIEPYQNGMYKVKLTVSGTSTRVSECFDLSDVVPAGARFFRSYENTSAYRDSGRIHTGAYVFNSAGQKIAGHVWVYNEIYSGSDVRKTECPEYSFSVTVSYVIRGAVTGEFIAEPAVIRNLGADVYSASERYIVAITDGEWAINKIYQAY